MSIRRTTHLIRSGRIFPYVLGRFLTVRKAYSVFRRVRPAGKQLPKRHETLFPQVDVGVSVSDLRKDAIALGFTLPQETVREIREYAHETKCKANETTFHFRDVQNGRLSDGTTIALAQVQSPKDCPAVKRVAEDPVLLGVCSAYLGFAPSHSDVRLFWSPASDLSDDERRKLSQTVDFHVDAYSYNFCYVHFYITDCDRDSGAHEMIKGSHRRKRFRWLIGSVRIARDKLARYYDKSSFLLIEGPAGSGFIEDTSCYHRASPPHRAPRLML